MFVLPSKAPLCRQIGLRLLWGPRGPSQRQEERLTSRQGKERGFGRQELAVHRGRAGEHGIHRGRWRTDGSDYHSILRDGGREVGTLGKRAINTARERETQDVVRVEKNIQGQEGRWVEKEHRHVVVVSLGLKTSLRE